MAGGRRSRRQWFARGGHAASRRVARGRRVADVGERSAPVVVLIAVSDARPARESVSVNAGMSDIDCSADCAPRRSLRPAGLTPVFVTARASISSAARRGERWSMLWFASPRGRVDLSVRHHRSSTSTSGCSGDRLRGGSSFGPSFGPSVEQSSVTPARGRGGTPGCSGSQASLGISSAKRSIRGWLESRIKR